MTKHAKMWDISLISVYFLSKFSSVALTDFSLSRREENTEKQEAERKHF